MHQLKPSIPRNILKVFVIHSKLSQFVSIPIMLLGTLVVGVALLFRSSLGLPDQARLFSDIYQDAKMSTTDVSYEEGSWGTGPEANVSGFRFYQETTSKFRVKSLPDIPFDIGELYSGQVPIAKEDPSRNLFFLFQPKIGAPTDTLTIWVCCGSDVELTTADYSSSMVGQDAVLSKVSKSSNTSTLSLNLHQASSKKMAVTSGKTIVQLLISTSMRGSDSPTCFG